MWHCSIRNTPPFSAFRDFSPCQYLSFCRQLGVNTSLTTAGGGAQSEFYSGNQNFCPCMRTLWRNITCIAYCGIFMTVNFNNSRSLLCQSVCRLLMGLCVKNFAGVWQFLTRAARCVTEWRPAGGHVNGMCFHSKCVVAAGKAGDSNVTVVFVCFAVQTCSVRPDV